MVAGSAVPNGVPRAPGEASMAWTYGIAIDVSRSMLTKDVTLRAWSGPNGHQGPVMKLSGS